MDIKAEIYQELLNRNYDDWDGTIGAEELSKVLTEKFAKYEAVVRAQEREKALDGLVDAVRPVHDWDPKNPPAYVDVVMFHELCEQATKLKDQSLTNKGKE